MKTTIAITAGLVALFSACSSQENTYDATGIFEGTEVVVSAEQNGRLMQFDVSEGSTVEENQQVGLIDTVQLALQARRLGAASAAIANRRPDIAKQVAVLRQQIAQAEQEEKRFRKLVEDGAANRKQLDDAQSAVRVLRRQLAAQQSALGSDTRALNSQVSANDIQKRQVLDQLQKCHVASPIAGTVLEKYAERGEFASIGRPLFKVADTKHVFLRAYVTGRQLAKMKVGQQVTVFSDYGDGARKKYQGRVTWISAQSEFTPKTILTDDERADQVYAVKVAVENDGHIKLGMYGGMNL